MTLSNQSVILQRDCDAVLVPAGTPVNLPAGTEVIVAQALGGNVTVNIYGNLARIATKDVDALGLDESELPTPPPIDYHLPLSEQIEQCLKTCYDPEIPVNIVDLGLIYHSELRAPTPEELAQFDTDSTNQETDRRKIAEITMTLTAPGCGFGPVLIEEIKSKLNALPDILETHIELVFDPPWSQEQMSEAAKLTLNLF